MIDYDVFLTISDWTMLFSSPSFDDFANAQSNKHTGNRRLAIIMVHARKPRLMNGLGCGLSMSRATAAAHLSRECPPGGFVSPLITLSTCSRIGVYSEDAGRPVSTAGVWAQKLVATSPVTRLMTCSGKRQLWLPPHSYTLSLKTQD